MSFISIRALWFWARAGAVLAGLSVMFGVAHARIDASGVTGGLLQTVGVKAGRTKVTEHQVRQLVGADPHARKALLSAMAQQLRVALERTSGERRAYPEEVVEAWLHELLARDVPPRLWSRRLDWLAQVYALLDMQLSALLINRVGVDDGLIRANALRLSGNFAGSGQLLDVEIGRAEQEQAAMPPETRRWLSDLLVVRALMAELRLDQTSSVHDLLQSAEVWNEDSILVATRLLIAVESAMLSGQHQLALETLSRTESLALARLQSAPGNIVWRRTQWFGGLKRALLHMDRQELSHALDAFKEAYERSRVPGVVNESEAALRRAEWWNLYGLSASGANHDPVVIRRHAEQALIKGLEETRRAPSEPDVWMMLGLSELMVGALDAAAGEAVNAETHLRQALAALDRLESLGDDRTDGLEVRMQTLMALAGVLQQRKAWSESLRQLDLVERLVPELKERLVGESNWAWQVYSVHMARAEAHRNLGSSGQSAAALTGAMEIAERQRDQESSGTDWELERWRVQSLMAHIQVEGAEPERVLQHRRQALLYARQATARRPGRIEWDERLWDSLHDLGDALMPLNGNDAAHAAMESRSLAQRHAIDTGADSEWSRKLFRSHIQLGDIEDTRERANDALRHYEVAIKLAQARYSTNASAAFALEDIWLAENRLSEQMLQMGMKEDARKRIEAAIIQVERGLKSEPESLTWLDRAAESHENMGELLGDNNEWVAALPHWQLAVGYSARRVVVDPDHSTYQMAHWRRLFYLGRTFVKLSSFESAQSALFSARDLARRFYKRSPEDLTWQVYLWFSEQEIGVLGGTQGNHALAESAYAMAHEVAATFLKTHPKHEVWLERSVDSMTGLAQAHLALGKSDDALRSGLLATQYRARLSEIEHDANRRKEANDRLSEVLGPLGLTASAANAFSKSELLRRLQDAIDEALTQAREQGMTEERSNSIRRLRNAMFAVRMRPD